MHTLTVVRHFGVSCPHVQKVRSMLLFTETWLETGPKVKMEYKSNQEKAKVWEYNEEEEAKNRK